MIHISQNRGRVWNAITNWSCSSPGQHCCLTLRFSVWTSAAHLICVRLTWRIRVQSVHLSPPILPTTALLVIKPPDQAAHTEKWTMTVLMRRVLATTSFPTRQIIGMNPCYDTHWKTAKPFWQLDGTSLLVRDICYTVIHLPVFQKHSLIVRVDILSPGSLCCCYIFVCAFYCTSKN